MNEAQVAALVTEVLGVEPSAVIFQPFGHNSITYEAVLPMKSVIVRMNADSSVFAATERNLVTLAGLGLPIPIALASDLSQSRRSFGYMVLDKIPGRDLRYELADMTTAQMTRLAEQIVGFQRRVTSLPLGTGYGYVGISETGPYASWRELVCFEQMPVQASRFETHFRQVPPTCFLDDITVKKCHRPERGAARAD